MNRLFVSNDTRYRLIRTIIQGIIGVLIANIDVLVGAFSFAPEVKALIVALVMAILSPIMSAMGVTHMDKEDVPHGYFEEQFEEGDSDDDSE